MLRMTVDRGYAPPIAGIGLQHDLDTGLGADEFVGSGADRVLLEPVIADFGQIFPGHDDPGGAGGGAVERHEVGPRLLQMETHHQRIDDLDLAALKPGSAFQLNDERIERAVLMIRRAEIAQPRVGFGSDVLG
jgi:hypothetical protein